MYSNIVDHSVKNDRGFKFALTIGIHTLVSRINIVCEIVRILKSSEINSFKLMLMKPSIWSTVIQEEAIKNDRSDFIFPLNRLFIWGFINDNLSPTWFRTVFNDDLTTLYVHPDPSWIEWFFKRIFESNNIKHDVSVKILDLAGKVQRHLNDTTDVNHDDFLFLRPLDKPSSEWFGVPIPKDNDNSGFSSSVASSTNILPGSRFNISKISNALSRQSPNKIFARGFSNKSFARGFSSANFRNYAFGSVYRIVASMTPSSILKEYLRIRSLHPSHNFSDREIDLVERAYYIERPKYNEHHPLLFHKSPPTTMYDSKGISDTRSLQLWNEIFDRTNYLVSKLEDIKPIASKVIEDYDTIYPKGAGMNEVLKIQYGQAYAASSFMGIQKPSSSSAALDSFKSTLDAHANAKVVYKPWLLTNLAFVADHIAAVPSIMERRFGDACLVAKTTSSSAEPGVSYRDWILNHTYSQILNMIYSDEFDIDKFIIAGVRLDRRGKYRLICSFHAIFRCIDYLINNGSYDLCSHQGILAQYTTEGFSDKEMWVQLVKMSKRVNGMILICLDYKGYDTQISLREYVELSRLLNTHRINSDPAFAKLFAWYENWLLQPKPLVTKTADGYVVLMDVFLKLASGLHGTHSFENLIGIATYLEAAKFFTISGFWSNGDDQNILILITDVDLFMKFIDEYFIVSHAKSLIGHDLGVWGKLWFSANCHPFWEMGTIRSIWEREGGETTLVEPSKFQSNYCKILQIAITLIRLEKPPNVTRLWIKTLCNDCDPKIDYTRIPSSLLNLRQLKSSKKVTKRPPIGLVSEKTYLLGKTFDLFVLGVSNYYNMALSMYCNQSFFTLEPDTIKYLPLGHRTIIERSVDYSINYSKSIPWIYAKFYTPEEYTKQQLLVRSILQSSKSYDGPSMEEYSFKDMYTLAHAVNNRNKNIWTELQSK
jgi:hypothetical protein